MGDFLDHASDFAGDFIDYAVDGVTALPEALPAMVEGTYDYLTGDAVGLAENQAEVDRVTEPLRDDYERVMDDGKNMLNDVGLFDGEGLL